MDDPKQDQATDQNGQEEEKSQEEVTPSGDGATTSGEEKAATE